MTPKYMYNKYSSLCQYALLSDDNKINNIISSTFFDNIQTSDFITKSLKILKNTENIHLPKIVGQYELYKIHDFDDYPLFYILFSKLYESGVLNKLYQEIPHDFTFDNFILWYRNNQYKLNIYQIMEELEKLKYNDPELIELYSLVFNTQGPRSKLHKLLYDNVFVSIDIHKHAETSDIKNIEYIFENGTQLTLYNVDSENTPNIQLLSHIIAFMDKLAEEVFKTDVVTKPKITIFSGLQKKILTTIDNILCPDNVNSGSTMRGDTIMIWRFEEVYKVLIHELVHFYGIDFYIGDIGYDKLENYISNNFCLSGFDRPNEAYTETLAVLLHTLFISVYMKENYSLLLRKELIHSCIQVNKILDFFNFKTIDDMYKKNSSTCDAEIDQRTSVFSYYILKTSLLFDVNKIFQFSKLLPTKNNISEFLTLISKSIKNPIFISTIKNIKEITNLEDEYIKTNLRMTCLQIN
jgi:hypothetical protein